MTVRLSEAVGGIMSPSRFSQRVLLLSILLPLCYFRLSSGEKQFEPFEPSCSVTDNYTTGSTYDDNLHILLDRLRKSALEKKNGGFANDTVGSPPDQVFGLMMCYADSDIFQCQTCLDQAATGVVHSCPYSNAAAACFDDCVVRYASTSFFSVALLTTEFSWSSDNNVSDTDGTTLARVREQLMTELIDNISQSAWLIATGNRTFNATQTMYGLVQCTRDLPVAECQRCLRAYVPKLNTDFPLQWEGWLYGYSCYIGYSLDSFDVHILPPPQSAKSPTQDHEGSNNKKKVATIAGVAVGSAAALLIVVVVLLRRCRPSSGHSGLQLPAATVPSNLVPRVFTLPELEAATNNFTRKIGSGAFGNVYRGDLPDGQVIAVKELLLGDRLNGFEKESEILGALRHRNIVGLVGYCHEAGRYMLCCEFVPDGNLEEHLFGNKKRFDWPARFNIIKGVCRGLIYLHEDSRRCTIHLDLKHSNILLHKNARGDMEPKISDFGISKMLEPDKADHETIRIIGSYGYMAPEYLQNGEVSSKADVYSFGIVILELITGLNNRNFSKGDLADEFIDHVRSQWKNGSGNISEIVDGAMGDKYSARQVRQCIEIALTCIQKDPTDRPDAKTIYYRLFDDGNAQV